MQVSIKNPDIKQPRKDFSEWSTWLDFKNIFVVLLCSYTKDKDLCVQFYQGTLRDSEAGS